MKLKVQIDQTGADTNCIDENQQQIVSIRATRRCNIFRSLVQSAGLPWPALAKWRLMSRQGLGTAKLSNFKPFFETSN
jgi:hypothetical protein